MIFYFENYFLNLKFLIFSFLRVFKDQTFHFHVLVQHFFFFNRPTIRRMKSKKSPKATAATATAASPVTKVVKTRDVVKEFDDLVVKCFNKYGGGQLTDEVQKAIDDCDSQNALKKLLTGRPSTYQECGARMDAVFGNGNLLHSIHHPASRARWCVSCMDSSAYLWDIRMCKGIPLPSWMLSAIVVPSEFAKGKKMRVIISRFWSTEEVPLSDCDYTVHDILMFLEDFYFSEIPEERLALLEENEFDDADGYVKDARHEKKEGRFVAQHELMGNAERVEGLEWCGECLVLSLGS
jgi:hypothetical protein